MDDSTNFPNSSFADVMRQPVNQMIIYIFYQHRSRHRSRSTGGRDRDGRLISTLPGAPALPLPKFSAATARLVELLEFHLGTLLPADRQQGTLAFVIDCRVAGKEELTANVNALDHIQIRLPFASACSFGERVWPLSTSGFKYLKSLTTEFIYLRHLPNARGRLIGLSAVEWLDLMKRFK